MARYRHYSAGEDVEAASGAAFDALHDRRGLGDACAGGTGSTPAAELRRLLGARRFRRRG